MAEIVLVAFWAFTYKWIKVVKNNDLVAQRSEKPIASQWSGLCVPINQILVVVDIAIKSLSS